MNCQNRQKHLLKNGFNKEIIIYIPRLHMETKTLTKSDLQKITEALTFWIVDMAANPANQRPRQEQREFKKLFQKVVRIKNSL